MSRRKAAPKRAILPDPLFFSEELAKFINAVMERGKKSLAEKIVYGALDEVVKHYLQNAKKSKEEEGGEGGESGIHIAWRQIKGDIRDSQEAREAALILFRKALDNVTPSVEVKSRRVGGSTYQVPVEIRVSRRRALAMRWMVEFASKRSESTMASRLAREMMDAIKNQGGAFKKKEDTHRMAKANAAYAHYKW